MLKARVSVAPRPAEQGSLLLPSIFLVAKYIAALETKVTPLQVIEYNLVIFNSEDTSRSSSFESFKTH